LFGTAPEDQEVTTVINGTIELLKKQGVEVVDVAVPGLDDLLASSSLINSEFKFDLADYLAARSEAPVKSLGDILDRGLYHLALESNFRARNAPERRDTDQYRRALIRREALRHAVDAVFAEQRLTAMLYPTIRRKPARIGDGQAGSACQLSAHTGLPALGLPAGWTDDGLPVGMDLLGPAWSEPALLALGFAVEDVLRPRRPPFSTPSLVGGKAPPPQTFTVTVADGDQRFGSVEFTYDVTTAKLSYKAMLLPAAEVQVIALWINRTEGGKVAAALHLLKGGAATGQGTVTLSYSDRQALADNRLVLRAYTKSVTGGITVPLRVTRASI
jgi:hypothetical protein